jgi:hypothetical protein
MLLKNIKIEANEIRKIIQVVKGKFKEGTESHKNKSPDGNSGNKKTL